MSIPYDERRRVVLKNVRSGSPLEGRDNIIYADLCKEDGSTMIAATLDYILKVAQERSYTFVSAD